MRHMFWIKSRFAFANGTEFWSGFMGKGVISKWNRLGLCLFTFIILVST